MSDCIYNIEIKSTVPQSEFLYKTEKKGELSTIKNKAIKKVNNINKIL